MEALFPRIFPGASLFGNVPVSSKDSMFLVFSILRSCKEAMRDVKNSPLVYHRLNSSSGDIKSIIISPLFLHKKGR